MTGLKGMDLIKYMKVTEPEQFHSMVKMHLSFLLDLHTDECDCSFLYQKQDKESKVMKAFTPMKKKSGKGVMDGIPLTHEGVCQVYQIIEYLGRSHNISTEGLFRKHGNLKKQQALKERLNKGVPLNLDDDEFSVHECAAVLKNFLANLPEPLLTDAYYRAHCQVPTLWRDDMSDSEKKYGMEKQISCLQLLFHLIPEVNFNLLRDLLYFLNRVTKSEKENKMSAANLGTVFSTHIMCPRKLSPETLQSNHQLLSKAVSFMIEHAEKLFTLPDKLVVDVESYMATKSSSAFQSPKSKVKKSAHISSQPNSPLVNTVFTFVDRQASRTSSNNTDEALAALYAHVQSMPESAQKKRLVSKLNEANGKGTPDVATSGSVRTVGRRHRRKSGDGLINLLTPRRKRPAHGSYSFQQPADRLEHQHSFRRQNSIQAEPTTGKVMVNTRSRTTVPSPSNSATSSKSSSTQSSRSLVSPTSQSSRSLVSSTSTSSPLNSSNTSDVCPTVDEVDTPGKADDDDISDRGGHDHDDQDIDDEPQLDGSYCEAAPPLPPRTPAPPPVEPRPHHHHLKDRTLPCGEVSPLTLASERFTVQMREEAMTPGSRAPVMVCSYTQLNKWSKLVPSSPCLEADGELSSVLTEEKENCDSQAEAGVEMAGGGKSKMSCRTRSLSNDFKKYLAEQGLEVADESSMEDSLLSNHSLAAEVSYSEDVRRILSGGEPLSTSMQAVLDGENPDHSSCPLSGGKHREKNMNQETVLSPGLYKEQARSYSDENQEPNTGLRRSGRKRRSLTEISASNPLQSQPHGNIFFETDL